MTQSTYYGATLLLKTTPDQERIQEIAASMAAVHFPEREYSFRLSRSVPEGLPVDVSDQLSAGIRDLPEDAVFLLVSPVVKEPTRNVKIPR